MEKIALKDFFEQHKKSLIISTILILTIALLLVFIPTDSFKNIVENISSKLEEINLKRDEYYAATVENDDPTCSLTKIEYPENAFSIGVPNGWLYEVNNGAVSIMEDETNTTAVFLYTAKLKQELTEEDFLNAFSRIFTQTIEEEENSTFEMQNIQLLENQTNADIVAKIGEYNIKGKMIASKSGDFVTFKAYWAPTEIFEERETILKDICGCFARTKVLTDDILLAKQKEIVDELNKVESKEQEPKKEQLPEGFKTYEGKYFKLDKSSDFKVDKEKENGIDLVKTDNRGMFTYAYTTELKTEYTPKSWLENMLSEMKGLKNLIITDGAVLPSDILGNSMQEFTFTASMEGIPIQGEATVGVYQPPYFDVGTKYASAFLVGYITTSENWESTVDSFRTMRDSLAFIDSKTPKMNTLLPFKGPIESLESSMTSKSRTYGRSIAQETGEKWIEGMNGYETVTSPSTGQIYSTPVNSWSSYGPEGQGYYRQLPDNKFEKLQ